MGLDSGFLTVAQIVWKNVSSPLSRARESAEIVADRLVYEKEDIVVEALLRERYFGRGEGLTIEERTKKYPNDNYPEMESLEELITRAQSVFEKIVMSFHDKNNILLVAHGAILYAILTAITDGQIPYGGKTVKFDSGSIHVIKYLDGAIELAKYGKEEAAFFKGRPSGYPMGGDSCV